MLPCALRLSEDRTLLRLRLLSLLLLLCTLGLLLLLLNTLLLLLPRLLLGLLNALGLLCSLRLLLLLLLLNTLLGLRLLGTLRLLLTLLRLLTMLLLLAAFVLPTLLIALLIVMLRVYRSHRSETQERGHAEYSYKFHPIHGYRFLSSPILVARLRAQPSRQPHLSAQHAEQVGDQENQQYGSKTYAGSAAGTPAAMSVVASTERQKTESKL